MSYNEDRFKASRVLGALRQSMSESEFGYRAQGLLAHVLIRLGGRIIDIKPQGHPDIVASLGAQTMFLQVKSVQAWARRRGFVLGLDDLEGIRPSDSATSGYLALLDCAPPISWILVCYDRLRRQGLRPLHLATLYAMANRKLSSEFTEEFVKLIADHQSCLRNINFHVLCSRALMGDAL